MRKGFRVRPCPLSAQNSGAQNSGSTGKAAGEESQSEEITMLHEIHLNLLCITNTYRYVISDRHMNISLANISYKLISASMSDCHPFHLFSAIGAYM